MTTKSMTQSKLHKQCEQFVLHMFKTLENEPQKLRSFKNLFLRSKRANNNILESQIRLVELIQDFPKLVRKLNELVPDEFKVKELDMQDYQQEEDEPMDINDIFAELNKRRPQKVQELITLIQEIKTNQKENNVEIFKQRISNILQDEPKLYKNFMKALGPAFEQASSEMEEETEPVRPSANVNEMLLEAESRKKPRTKVTKIEKEKIYAMKRTHVQRGFRRREVENSVTQVTIARETKETSEVVLPSTLRNEMYLFEYLEKNLSSEAYNELMKIIYLYTECIMSSNEVFIVAKDIFDGNENYFSFFQEIIFSREALRRKNTQLFKPLGDIDFKKFNCERLGSYSNLPEFFPYAKSPLHPHSSQYQAFLNRSWVSVPTGSETNFTVNTRNTYEVNLFLCEDEKYEFDIALSQYEMTIKWLQTLDSIESDEKRSQLIEKILKLKTIQKVYGNNPEIVDLFKKNPVHVAKIVIDRIQTKVQEIREIKNNQAKKKWEDVAAQNFHRSLDHRSYFFKQSEKKVTSHKSFIPEAQTRHKEINILGQAEKTEVYCNVLDSFQGLSNGKACSHPVPNNLELIKQGATSSSRKVLPIYQMLFSDKQIIQDMFDILSLKTQYFHATLTEKEKINRYLKVFMTELLNLPYKTEKSYENIPDYANFLNIVLPIESKIFTKSFTFKTSKTNDQPQKEIDENSNPLPEEKSTEKEKEKTKKSGMEIEAPEGKGKSKGQNNNGKTDATENKEEDKASEDEIRLDSVSEEQTNVKEMEYADKFGETNGLFTPPLREGQKIFYGTQHVYCLIRYYFTLYERFVKAREVSNEFEDNSKTRLLSPSEKEALSKERYENFKLILSNLIRSNLDNEKYEDLLRNLFGNSAYLMFYIDKIIHSIIITLQKVYGDDISLRTLNLFTESDLFTKTQDVNKNKANLQRTRNWSESVYLSQLNQLTLKYINNIQNTTFFRFLYHPDTQLITISLFDWSYKDWKDKVLENVAVYSRSYLTRPSNENCLENSESPVFLNKNKETNRKKSVTNLAKIFQTHNIEWKFLPNTQKMVTDKIHQEEVLFIVKKKMDKAEELKKKVYSNCNKLQRFKAWHRKFIKV